LISLPALSLCSGSDCFGFCRTTVHLFRLVSRILALVLVLIPARVVCAPVAGLAFQIGDDLFFALAPFRAG
jgi:hypothetical protein